MIKISDNNRKIYYYVSNLTTGTLTIIDGSSNEIVKNIFVGERPFQIIPGKSNKIYIACDRSSNIAVFDLLSEEVKTIFIANNGNFDIDELNNRMFVSNTSEIHVYDRKTDKLIESILGFSAVCGLKLSKDSSKLFVLDKLLCEFRIYSTVDYKLIYAIKNIGINPGFLLISEDDETAYISFENNHERVDGFDILKIDLAKKTLKRLTLDKGAIITGMFLKDNILYAANKGLNRIELIDRKNFKAYDYILTSLPEPSRLYIRDDSTKLLVTNRNSGAGGNLDIIDITTNCLIGKVLMTLNNSQPFDVISISEEYLNNKEEYFEEFIEFTGPIFPEEAVLP